MGRKPDKYRLRVDAHVDWEMMESEAFKSLSATAIRVLLRFLQKRKWTPSGKRGNRSRKPIYDNNGLTFTYAEAEALGIPTSTFHVSVKALVEVGFLDVAHQGGIYKNDYSRYNISERWRGYGTPSFQAVVKGRVLQQGCDVRARMNKKDATENCNEPLQKTVVVEAKVTKSGFQKSVVMKKRQMPSVILN